MCGPQQHDGQIHPEVEDLEDLRLGKGQDEDSSKLCQRDPTENLRQDGKQCWGIIGSATLCVLIIVKY